MDRVVVPANETGADAPVQEPVASQEGRIEPQVNAVEGNVASSRDNRPEWLPEKFRSPEEMAKAYQELEKRMGGNQEQEEQPVQNREQQPQPISPEEQKALQEWDNKFSSFSNEYYSSGRLSNESYDKLNKMGFPKSVVDAFIDGQQAVANQGTQSLMAEIGGNDGFKAMHDWATETLSQDEIDNYNAILDSGDTRQASYAVKGMYARFKSSGKAPKLIAGGTGASSATNPFRSVAEMTRAMADPRYKTDSAYRKDVEKRLVNSRIL